MTELEPQIDEVQIDEKKQAPFAASSSAAASSTELAGVPLPFKKRTKPAVAQRAEPMQLAEAAQPARNRNARNGAGNGAVVAPPGLENVEGMTLLPLLDPPGLEFAGPRNGAPGLR